MRNGPEKARPETLILFVFEGTHLAAAWPWLVRRAACPGIYPVLFELAHQYIVVPYDLGTY